MSTRIDEAGSRYTRRSTTALVTPTVPLTTPTVGGRQDMADAKPTKSIIQCQLKLKLRPAQERMLNRWLWRLTGVYNWTIRKVEVDARFGIYHRSWRLEGLLKGHGAKIGIPTHTVQATVRTAANAWERCYRRLSNRPRLKGRRNRLNSIPFPDPISVSGGTVVLAGLKSTPLKFHKQAVPYGQIKSGRMVKRTSGWYLCLFIAAEPQVIPIVGNAEIGIDPGFKSLIALSTGELVEHPRELALTAGRLAQAQRGRRATLTARLKERESNQRKDRNHKLSRRLMSENALVCWSKDNHQAIARSFGKSVASAAHGQLRQMLAYKCRTGGREFIEVSGRYSTMTCSACGARSGPTGYAGLSVRQWTCGCGAVHERDVNAARNTLIAGRGLRLERGREAASGIAL